MAVTIATAAALAGGGAGVAQAHTLPLRAATKMAQKLANGQVRNRDVGTQTLSEGRRVTPHRVVFDYSDVNRAGTFTCRATIVVKLRSATSRKAIAYFNHIRCSG